MEFCLGTSYILASHKINVFVIHVITLVYVTSSAISDLMNMYFDSSVTIMYYEMVEQIKLGQIIAKFIFSKFFNKKIILG